MKKSSKPIPHHLPDFFKWLEVGKGVSPKTQENYRNFLERFLDFLEKKELKDIKPHELTKDHIWQYRLFLSHLSSFKSGEPLKRTTQNYYLIALRSLLTFFAERDILSLPPEKAKLPKTKKERKINFLKLEQIKDLLEAPDISTKSGLRDRAILETFFSTGIRVSELVSLDREQIKSGKNNTLEISIVGKGGTPRTIYFSERALEWLNKYLKTRNDDEKALFINYRGRNPYSRLTARSIERRIKKYASQVGLPYFTSPHVIRHSFATDLLKKGVSLRAIQEFLGHKNLATTQIYTHVTDKQLRDIHRKFHGGKKLNKDNHED